LRPHDTNRDDSAPRRVARAEAVLQSRRRSLCVVLEDAHDPHNVSAALRTCEALGVQDVHLVAAEQEIAPLNPKVSIGAHRWLTLHRHRGVGPAVEALRAANYRICVSHLEARSTPLPGLDRRGRTAYVFGNERDGVSEAWLAAADATFVIPTCGFSGSLNLSVAVALTVYDRLFGRRGAKMPAGDLTEAEKSVLRTAWFDQLAGGDAERAREYAAFLARPVAPRPLMPADRRRHGSTPAPARRAVPRPGSS